MPTEPADATVAADEGGSRTRLVILGSGGGPVVHQNLTRRGPANLVTVDGHPQKSGRNVVELATDGREHRIHVAWLAAAAVSDELASSGG